MKFLKVINSFLPVIFIIIFQFPKTSLMVKSNEFTEVELPFEIKDSNPAKFLYFSPSYSSSRNEVVNFNPLNYETSQQVHRRNDIFEYKSRFEIGNKERGLKSSSSDPIVNWPEINEPIDLEPTIKSKDIAWPEEARKLRRYEYFEEKEEDDRPRQRMMRARRRMNKARRKVYKIEPIHIDEDEGHAGQDDDQDYDDGRLRQKGSDRRKVFKKKVKKMYPNKFKKKKVPTMSRRKSPSKRRKLFIVAGQYEQRYAYDSDKLDQPVKVAKGKKKKPKKKRKKKKKNEFERSWAAVDGEGNRNEPTTDSDEVKNDDGESRRKKRIQEVFVQNIRDGLITDRKDGIKYVTAKPVIAVPVPGVNVDEGGINNIQNVYEDDERADREEYRTDYKDFLTDYDDIRVRPREEDGPNSVQDVRDRELLNTASSYSKSSNLRSFW